MNWLWSQVFQGSVKNVFAVSVPSLTLAGTVQLHFRRLIPLGHAAVKLSDLPHLPEESEQGRPVPGRTDALVVAPHEGLAQPARARPVRPRHHVDAVRVRRRRLAGEAALWKCCSISQHE